MSRLENIQAITFDVGGTLIRPWPSVGHVYAEVAARHGLENLPVETLNRQFAAAWRAARNFNHTRDQWAELVDHTFAGLSKEPPSRTFFPELYLRFAEPEAWHVYEDVMPALDTLASRGIKLGIVSNWDERLRPLLRDLNLDKYFEVIVVSCEVGFSKPSPVIFEQASEKLGVVPERVLHVGDGFELDVQGARSAGLHGLQINRQGGAVSTGQIKSLRELEED